MYGGPSRGGRGGWGRLPGRGGHSAFSGPGQALGPWMGSGGMGQLQSHGSTYTYDHSNTLGQAAMANDYAAANQQLVGFQQYAAGRENQALAVQSAAIKDENEFAQQRTQIIADQTLARNKEINQQTLDFVESANKRRETSTAAILEARNNFLNMQAKADEENKNHRDKIRTMHAEQDFRDTLRRDKAEAAHEKDMSRLKEERKALKADREKWLALGSAVKEQGNNRLLKSAADFAEKQAKSAQKDRSVPKQRGYTGSNEYALRILAATNATAVTFAPARPAQQLLMSPSTESYSQPQPQPQGEGRRLADLTQNEFDEMMFARMKELRIRPVADEEEDLEEPVTAGPSS